MIQINKLKKNEAVKGRLLVAEIHLSHTKEGKPFLKLALMNRTGRIEGILWEKAEQAFRAVRQGWLVEVQGSVGIYQQEPQIKLQAISPVPEEEQDLSGFLPSSSRSKKEMKDEIHRVIGEIRNPFLRRLLEDIFRDPDVWDAFSRAPAAKGMHHAFLGGLLEHSLSLVRLVQLALKNYPFLDQDLMIAGALLHDLGKARELSPELGFDYTDEGRLLGHILIGLALIEKKISAIPEFPGPLATNLKHIVASHHGELEFGSPKQPVTLEACCLHMLDSLDAKLLGIHEYMKKEAQGNKQWTPFHRVHQRFFYIPESLRQEAGPGEGETESVQASTPDLFGSAKEDE